MTTPITPLPTPPNRSTDTPSEFADNADAFSAAQVTFGAEVNIVGGEMEALAAQTEADAAIASNAASVANYQGPYNAGTTYAVGEAVDYLGVFWASKQNGNIGNTPVGGSAFWQKIETTAVSVDETGFDLDWSVDDVLKFTATADFAITFSNIPSAGVAFTEITGGGDWTPTYPVAVVWDEGTEPALATGTDTTVLQFYTSDTGTKVMGRRLYGVIA